MQCSNAGWSGLACLLLIICSSTSVVSPAAAAAEQPGVPVLWEDFKTLDRSIWTVEIGDGSDNNTPGWGNNELQCYTDTPANIEIIPNPETPGDGILRFRSAISGAPKPCDNRVKPPVPKTWTSARITSQGGFTPVGTGTGCGPLRIEARIKMPVKQGHWGGFWSLGTQGVWPASGEIDIAEHANKDPFYYATTHYASPTGLHVQQPLPPVNQVPVRNPAGWNVYRVDWSCDSIIWSLNGEQRSRLNKAQAANWVFDKPFKLILNLAVGGDLPGNDADPAGGEMLVDWVKVTAPPGTQVPTQGW